MMKFLVYIFIQTGHNLKQTWGTQLMTLLTVSLSVLIFTFFFLVYTNMLKAGTRFSDDLRLIVYLEKEVVPEMQIRLKQKIREFDEVEKIIFISQQDAFNHLSRQLDKDQDVLNDLGPSFLPSSIEVYPQKKLENLARLKQFSDYLATLPGVAKVQYGREWIERFGYFTKLLRIIVLLSGGLLILTAIFMVSYTIRLTMVSRQAELEILRLLGATNTFIKGPLLVEGVIQGLLGSAIGLSFLYLLFRWIKIRFSGPGLLSLFELTFFPSETMAFILFTGVILCASGSMVSIRKFLRI